MSLVLPECPSVPGCPVVLHLPDHPHNYRCAHRHVYRHCVVNLLNILKLLLVVGLGINLFVPKLVAHFVDVNVVINVDVLMVVLIIVVLVHFVVRVRINLVVPKLVAHFVDLDVVNINVHLLIVVSDCQLVLVNPLFRGFISLLGPGPDY